TFAGNTASNTAPNDSNAVAPAPGTIYTFTPSTVEVTWSPATDLYTDLAATTPYTGQNRRVVYSKPTQTRTYTSTSTTSGGCTGDMDVTVTNHSINIANITGGANTYCLGSGDPVPDFDTATPGVTWTSSNPAVATINSS